MFTIDLSDGDGSSASTPANNSSLLDEQGMCLPVTLVAPIELCAKEAVANGSFAALQGV